MNLQQILKASRIFYRDHHLPAWREALPKKVELEDEAAILERCAKNGFTHGFAFPPFGLQMAMIEQLIEETVRKPATELPDNQQYTSDLVLSDTWSKKPNGKILQRTDDLSRRNEEPYLFLFSPIPVRNAWGRTGKQIAELFHVKDWQGLTVPEYFVLQRYFCEKYGDHRFFAVPEGESGAHWIWLVDSMTDAACTVVLGKARGLNLQGCPVGNRDSRRAAIAGRVVPFSVRSSSVRSSPA
jgi:hypothetical protein